jgi:Fic family protein
MYIWEQADWPTFHWNDQQLLEPPAEARLKQGCLLGRMAEIGFSGQQEAQLEALTEDAVKSSEIEGEILDRDQVRSSLARHLGVEISAVTVADRRTEGVVDMILDATEHFDTALTIDRLFAWHAALFPTGFSHLHRIAVGTWRNDVHGPMQVVSGPVGRHRIHYQAPPAHRLGTEIEQFLAWFNEPDILEGLLRAGIAHLWFVTIHPFDDGNGRIARAITDNALAYTEHSRQRFYSMSSQLRKERSAYYDILEQTQRGTLDITNWLVWFLGCFSRAIDGAAAIYTAVLHKADFWRRHADIVLTARQIKVLNRYLDGSEGHLTTKKWAAIGKCSIPSAQRDINTLIEQGVLRRMPGGSKKTSYETV